ncbi:MAG: ATP-dependent helicase [Planctomycetaceae bacterium]|nr:ATP-dependent helicase [Planctomycetaceae bacterium]MCB9951281.1 ATP-dependent helicase [Planctomycetaceae bacterium]
MSSTDALNSVLSKLNPAQRAAACHGKSPLLIIAGAGTGKTTTLAHRVAALVASGVDPARMLLLTFTRRASAELLRRAQGIVKEFNDASDSTEGANQTGAQVSGAALNRVWGGTFHSVAARLLRRFGKLIGVPPDFTIMDRGDSEDLMHVLREDLKLGQEEKPDESDPAPQNEEIASRNRFPLKGTCMGIYSRAVNTQWTLKKVLEEAYPWCADHEEDLKRLFNAYVDTKDQNGVMDYDDLLLFWQALMEDESAGAKVRERFDCVLVDEYQDTNSVQAAILKGLCPDGTGLTVVGDDAQSIYSFRAATVRNILDFPEEFPGTCTVKLEQNYRSTSPILAATNAVIAASKERHEKELWSDRTEGNLPEVVICEDEDEQTEFVIDNILAHRENGIRLTKQAVLFRASHHSMTLEVELARRNVPFHKFGGLKFVETAHVKDAVSFLKFAENPRDIVSGTRILVLLPGIGQRRARQLLQQLAENAFDLNTWKSFAPPKATSTDWPLFCALLIGLSGPHVQGLTVQEQFHRVVRFYAPVMERRYDDPRARKQDLEQLELIAGRFQNRSQFLTEMTLDPPSSTQDLAGDPILDEDYLILSTIHSAKGLEWDTVHVIHAADGNIPSDLATGNAEQIEEERRLFYVALTRAKDHLTVTIPQRYYFHGRFRSDQHSYAQPTRFLTKAALKHFRQRVARVHEEPEDDLDVPTDSSHIRQRIKRRW